MFLFYFLFDSITPGKKHLQWAWFVPTGVSQFALQCVSPRLQPGMFSRSTSTPAPSAIPPASASLASCFLWNVFFRLDTLLFGKYFFPPLSTHNVGHLPVGDYKGPHNGKRRRDNRPGGGPEMKFCRTHTHTHIYTCVFTLT